MKVRAWRRVSVKGSRLGGLSKHTIVDVPVDEWSKMPSDTRNDMIFNAVYDFEDKHRMVAYEVCPDD